MISIFNIYENILEDIANMIREFNLSGYSPRWYLSFEGIPLHEVSEYSVAHIAKCVEGGCFNGEIIEDKYNGWWFVEINEKEIEEL